MIRKTALCLVTSGALLVAAAALSQTESEDDGTPSSGTRSSGTQATDTQAGTAPESRESAGAGRDESPYDYQASEEISEDLSVSFPVDI